MNRKCFLYVLHSSIRMIQVNKFLVSNWWWWWWVATVCHNENTFQNVFFFFLARTRKWSVLINLWHFTNNFWCHEYVLHYSKMDSVVFSLAWLKYSMCLFCFTSSLGCYFFDFSGNLVVYLVFMRFRYYFDGT